MITKQQATKILILASNYGQFSIAASEWDMHGEYDKCGEADKNASEAWLQLKSIIDELTEK